MEGLRHYSFLSTSGLSLWGEALPLLWKPSQGFSLFGCSSTWSLICGSENDSINNLGSLCCLAPCHFDPEAKEMTEGLSEPSKPSCSNCLKIHNHNSSDEVVLWAQELDLALGKTNYGNRSGNCGCLWGWGMLTWKEREGAFQGVESFNILIVIVVPCVKIHWAEFLKFCRPFCTAHVKFCILHVKYTSIIKQSKTKKNPKPKCNNKITYSNEIIK